MSILLMIGDIKNFAFRQHDVECNQKYNKTLPYSFHLEMVAAQAERFSHLLKVNERWVAYAGAYCHDLIEDARMTYNDIKQLAGEEVAEIVFACTELRGKTRGERHGDEYFTVLNQNHIAIFVKLCDIIANALFSLLSNSSMFSKYASEFDNVKSKIYREEFDEMFSFLSHTFSLNKTKIAQKQK